MMTNAVGDNTHIEVDSTDFKINNFPDNNSTKETICTNIINDCEPAKTEINTETSVFEDESVNSQDVLESSVNASIGFQTDDDMCLISNANGNNKNDSNQIGKTIDVEDNITFDTNSKPINHSGIMKYQYNSFIDSQLEDIVIPETKVDKACNNDLCSDIDDLLNLDLAQILNLEVNTETNRCLNDRLNGSLYRVTALENYVLKTASLSAPNNNLEANCNQIKNIDFVQASNSEKVVEMNCIKDELKDNNDISSSASNNNSEYNSVIGSNLVNNVNVDRNVILENHGACTNKKHVSDIDILQTSNLEQHTESNFINDQSINNICTQMNNDIETDILTAKIEDDISPYTSCNDDESNESQLLKLEILKTVEINKNDLLNDNVGIDCVDFTIPNKAKDQEMNKDQNPLEAILADYHSNKSKAASNNLMPKNKEKNVTQIEAKFPRSHKEIITPDFGNIVKNVHGIFSSVSGSLINAYNTRPNTNYNILKYGHIPKKEEKTSNSVILTTTDSSKESINVSDASESPVSKSSIVTTELYNPLANDLDKKSEPNYPIDHEGTVQQNLMDSNETVSSNVNEGNNIEVYRLQIQTLEASLAEQRKEVNSLRDRVKQQSDELINKDHICKDIENKMDMMRKRVERAESAADASVMRYATSERTVLEARSAADNAKKAEKQALAEAELLNGKLRSAHAEKARICRLLDDKIHELSQIEREVIKLREDARATDTKLKWTQNKLRTEMDAYKESTGQVEKLTEQLTELQSRMEITQANAQDSIKAKDLESQLRQCQASLILEKHERDGAESKLKQISLQAETSSAEVARNIRELEELRLQVKKLSANNLELEEEAAELATLRAKAALSDTLALQLQSERARAFAAEESRAGAEARGAAAALREGAALEHAAKVTAEHVAAQAKAHQHEAKALALAADNVSLRERLSFLESEVTRLQTELSAEASRRRQQTEAMSTRVTELQREVDDERRKLEWEVGESAVLKKKHASATKELNRELQRSLKRCQYLESRYSAAEEKTELSKKRAGSISSINSLEVSATCQSSSDEGHVNGHPTPHAEEPSPEYQSEGPSRQLLIERVVDLQRAAARRAERCDFLEEHTRALTAELRNKTRLVRHLAAAQPSGALDTPQRDQHKSEVARKGGGAMAAVYGGDTNGLTLELSLEMNQKLQAVLEDALLKNITLRENMDTLGAEIARLKSVQREITN